MNVLRSIGKHSYTSENETVRILIVLSDGRSICEYFPINEAPDEDAPPSLLAGYFKERVKKYLICTDREKINTICDWIIEHAEEVDEEWAQAQIDMLERKIKSIEYQQQYYRRYLR
jgi:hypothetical protein